VGRKYREVPSNTKVSFFQAYATGVQPFRAVISSTRMPNAFTTLAKLDQDQTCLLQHGAEMVQALTEGIVKLDRVVQCKGYVVAANLAEKVSLRFHIGLPQEGNKREKLGSWLMLFVFPFRRLLPGQYGSKVRDRPTSLKLRHLDSSCVRGRHRQLLRSLFLGTTFRGWTLTLF
jgi:hypothetical protein